MGKHHITRQKRYSRSFESKGLVDKDSWRQNEQCHRDYRAISEAKDPASDSQGAHDEEEDAKDDTYIFSCRDGGFDILRHTASSRSGTKGEDDDADEVPTARADAEPLA